MSQFRPYQPALLRILHGAAAILVILSLISGFWVYNTYDRRWGALPLPRLDAIQDIHGTIALTFFLLFPLFALYSFHIGDRRLTDRRSLQQLQRLGDPVGWVSLHRLTNTVMLLASTLAIVTGRMMKEAWLPAGDLDRLVYFGHLIAWACVFFCLMLHLLLSAKLGGVPLLISMFRWGLREGDAPRSWLQGIRWQPSSAVLKGIEIVTIAGIFIAAIAPLF